VNARPKLDVANAIVRRGSQVLLVFQGRVREERFWALPGGIVEDDELIPSGLVREVLEETGISIEALGWLAYVAQVDHYRPARLRGRDVPGYLATIWSFEVRSWSGEIHVDDPDGVVVDAAFVDREEAVARLERTEWLSLAAGYLRGDVPRGSFHVERWLADGTVERADPLAADL
jgi:ADP-ribose pyrophosphatase YjhB (NUDIX family)